MTRKIELLAPARDAATARVAIAAGADAVYIGAPAFGARAAAGNSIEDIAGLTSFVHQFRAKVYVTMNTILFDSELAQAERMVWQLYAAGVDALIVQDMAYLEMKLPPIALHASTQCDIRTPEKAAWLAKAGFSQLVLARELNLDEIRACAEAAQVPVEVFVHGALCVSYSGDCQAGQAAMGRSANRGVCPQMCRLSYELVDENGTVLAPEKHYLSLRDLNRLQNMRELVEAGASSFKIEGRLKDARYVANVVAAYSRELDRIVAQSEGKYVRSSYGRSEITFTPDVDRTFNRSYTSYFLRGKPAKMASLDTPKCVGRQVAVVKRYNLANKSLKVNLSAELANGDGLGYFDPAGRFTGFRLNRIEGDTLYSASPLDGIKFGTLLYRNSDKAFNDTLDRFCDTAARTIAVDIEFKPIDRTRCALCAGDERGISVELIFDSEYAAAKTPQTDQRRRVLEKTGGTIYKLREFTDADPNRFVPASVLTDARRQLISLLDATAAARYTFDRRKASTLADDAFSASAPLTYHDNVANALAEKFYLAHGATISQKALEVMPLPAGNLRVMSTRYCIRRELGACLKEKNRLALPSPLFLRNASGRYRLDFDCARCGMNIIKVSEP